MWPVIVLTFFEFFKVFLTNVIEILMISGKFATPGLLKTTAFWKKCFDDIIPVHNVANKSLSRNSNYIAFVSESLS